MADATMFLVWAEFPKNISEEVYKKTLENNGRMVMHFFRNTEEEAVVMYEKCKFSHHKVGMFRLVLEKQTDSSVSKVTMPHLGHRDMKEAPPPWL